MYGLPYNKNFKDFSRKLRNNSALGEIFSEEQVRKDMDIVLKVPGNYIAEFERRHCISLQNVSGDSKYVE
jgi:hypothetical protein